MATEILKNYPAYKPKGKEEYMNSRQLAHFRKMLEEMKTGLSQDIDLTDHPRHDAAPIMADPTDRASQDSDMSLDLRPRYRDRHRSKKIDETIARIDA
ncbi:MAG: RNA polymerase-binding protein DksA, partial [Betaproteobacteria bacterium]